MNVVRSILRATLCVVAVTSISSPLLAQQPGQGRAKKYVATRAITVDRQSGALRLPTAEETQALVDRLTAMTSQSPEGLRTVTLPSGVKSVSLQDRFQNVMLTRPNEDGSSELRCVSSFEEAAEFLGLVEAPAEQ